MDNTGILIIDDELHIREFLRAAFEFEGFAVQEARDAEEGIRSATLKPPSLIILDLGLPDRDGSSIIKRLRSWSNTPIIVLSVRSSQHEKVRLLACHTSADHGAGLGQFAPRRHALPAHRRSQIAQKD